MVLEPPLPNMSATLVFFYFRSFLNEREKRINKVKERIKKGGERLVMPECLISYHTPLCVLCVVCCVYEERKCMLAFSPFSSFFTFFFHIMPNVCCICSFLFPSFFVRLDICSYIILFALGMRFWNFVLFICVRRQA